MVNCGRGRDRRVMWGHLLQGVAQDVHGGGIVCLLLDNLWVWLSDGRQRAALKQQVMCLHPRLEKHKLQGWKSLGDV